ncbi:MAG: MFS transporter [Treponema sp.]|jgi:Na+/melibiose symporter-like transporter|nr:MFS transporter [Treponema sp.]
MAEKKIEQPNPDKLSPGKLLIWRTAPFSVAASFIVISYLSIYCTDTLGMPAALVGTILLASKVFDGVTDLFAGYLIDRTNTRFGKGRPYDFALIGVWVSTILMFSVPDFGLVGKSIWVFFAYVFANGVFATLYNAAQGPYVMRAWPNMRVITKTQSYGGAIGTLFTSFVSIGFPIMMRRMAVSTSGWSRVVLMFAIPILIIGSLRFFFIKEQYEVGLKTAEKIRLKDIVQVLKVDPYVWVAAIISFLAFVLSGMHVATYYFTWIVGDIGKYGTLQSLTLFMLTSMFFFPKIIKKYSVSFVISWGAISGLIGSIFNFIGGSNMILLAIGFIFTGLAMLPTSYLLPLMVLNCGTYNEWKGLDRFDGTMGSVRFFMDKVGAGIGSALLGFLLGASGYNGSAAVQADSALAMIRASYSIIPFVIYILILIVIRFYKVDKMLPQIEKDLVERRAAAAAQGETLS